MGGGGGGGHGHEHGHEGGEGKSGWKLWHLLLVGGGATYLASKHFTGKGPIENMTGVNSMDAMKSKYDQWTGQEHSLPLSQQTLPNYWMDRTLNDPDKNLVQPASEQRRVAFSILQDQSIDEVILWYREMDQWRLNGGTERSPLFPSHLTGSEKLFGTQNREEVGKILYGTLHGFFHERGASQPDIKNIVSKDAASIGLEYITTKYAPHLLPDDPNNLSDPALLQAMKEGNHTMIEVFLGEADAKGLSELGEGGKQAAGVLDAIQQEAEKAAAVISSKAELKSDLKPEAIIVLAENTEIDLSKAIPDYQAWLSLAKPIEFGIKKGTTHFVLPPIGFVGSVELIMNRPVKIFGRSGGTITIDGKNVALNTKETIEVHPGQIISLGQYFGDDVSIVSENNEITAVNVQPRWKVL